jgi:5-methylcytosine-specific restriction endonuclease McrA
MRGNNPLPANACCVANARARDPQRVAAYRAKEMAKRAAMPKPPKATKYCVDCGIEANALRCDPCGKAQARERARLWYRANHPLSARICQECGEGYDGTPTRSYCSMACRCRAVKRTARKAGKARKRAATVESVNPTKVFMRDGWRCHLCGGMTDKSKRGTMHPKAPELDHIVPLARGGEHSYANTACAHKKCNAAKSDKIIGQPSLLAA